MSDVDVAIVGAGAAGIGAARRLAGSRHSLLVIEASERIGGRAWTQGVAGMPLDLGCGWLHSAERNPWTRIAEEQGFAIDRTPSTWGRQYRDLGFSPEEQHDARVAYCAFDDCIRQTPPPSDRASDALTPGEPWNGYIEALSGYINGAGLATLSVADYLAYDDAASDTNWRVPAGYGTLIVASMPRVPVAVATPVSRIDHHGERIALETPRGTVRARVAIVTASTDVLARGDIAFARGLDDHLHAAANLPLGLANKLFLALDADLAVESDRHLIGNPRSERTGSYYLRPFARPVIECFFGGDGAADLEAAGLDASARFAIDELASLLGSDVRKRLHLIAGSAWRSADGFGGSYSHARPGHAGARSTLASPVAERIFFAGEACSLTDFSTAHGALASGTEAAERALAALD